MEVTDTVHMFLMMWDLMGWRVAVHHLTKLLSKRMLGLEMRNR